MPTEIKNSRLKNLLFNFYLMAFEVGDTFVVGVNDFIFESEWDVRTANEFEEEFSEERVYDKERTEQISAEEVIYANAFVVYIVVHRFAFFDGNKRGSV